MDNETRSLPPNEVARAPGAEPPPSPQPTISLPSNEGTPTTTLPPTEPPSSAQGTRYAVPPRPAEPNNTRPNAPYGPRPYFGRRSGLLPLLIIAAAVLAFLGRYHYGFGGPFFGGGSGSAVGSAFPLALGLIFLYASRRSGFWGLSIPGYILTGIGAGTVLAAAFGAPGFAALGLGCGFLALWAQNRAQWWWLIPAAAIGLGGLAQLGF